MSTTKSFHLTFAPLESLAHLQKPSQHPNAPTHVRVIGLREQVLHAPGDLGQLVREDPLRILRDGPVVPT